MSSTNSKLFAVTALAAMILVGVFGIGMGNMNLNKNGEKSGCIFTGKVMLCQMNVAEHIALWQSMFRAIPTKTIIPALLFFLVASAIVFIALHKNLLSASLLKHLTLRQYQHYQLNNISFNPIRYALAKGILHTKIYEPAHI